MKRTKTLFGVQRSRLFVLLSMFLMPIWIFVAFYVVDVKILWLPDTLFIQILIKWIVPLAFAFSWFYMIWLFKEELSNTIEFMDSTASVIPNRMNFFFLTNALLMLLLFLMPIISPIFTVLMFASLIWRLLAGRNRAVGEESLGKGGKAVIAIFSLFPLIASIILLPSFYAVAGDFWRENWMQNLDMLNAMNLALASGITFGNFYFLVKVFMEGRGSFKYLEEGAEQNAPFYSQKVTVAILVTALMAFLWLTDNFMYMVLNGVGLLFVCLIFLLNQRVNKSQTGFQISNNLLGYILVVVFFAANIFVLPGEHTNFVLQNVLLIVAGGFYILVFLLAFVHLHKD